MHDCLIHPHGSGHHRAGRGAGALPRFPESASPAGHFSAGVLVTVTMGGMSRRTARPRPTVTAASPCLCGLPAPYGDCCGRLHQGRAAAPTAEALMRSRYSAYVTRDQTYLLRTWHPGTRPPRLDFDPALRWLGLDVLATTDGSPFHTEGTVTFEAHCTDRGGESVLREHSRFVRHEGAWVYHDALPSR